MILRRLWSALWTRDLSSRPVRPKFRGPARLTLECLEERATPASLVAASYFDSAIYQFNTDTGAVEATLVAPNSSGLLSGPAGLAVGPDGNVYISSQSNNAILRYNFATTTLEPFIDAATLNAAAVAMSGPGTQFQPAGLAFGPDGDLYVAANGGYGSGAVGGVVRFDVVAGSGLSYNTSSTPVAVASGLTQPKGLIFGATAGEQDSLFVSHGDIGVGAPGSFGNIVKIDDATTAPTVSPTWIVGVDVGLQIPAGLTWGDDGRLYVTDVGGAFGGSGKVMSFTANGTDPVVVTPGGFAPGDLAFSFPSAVVFDDNHRMLTANLGASYPPILSGSISRYDLGGAYVDEFATSALFAPNGFSPSQLVMLPAAKPTSFVAGSFFDSSLTQYALADGDVEETFVGPYSSATLSGPAGLAYGPDHRIYISSQSNNAILRYNLATDMLETVVSSAVLSGIAATLNPEAEFPKFAPSGLEFGPDGHLYVVSNGGFGSADVGGVIRFDMRIGASGYEFTGTHQIVASGLTQPKGLAFGVHAGDKHSLYVTHGDINLGVPAPGSFGDVVKISNATTIGQASTFITGFNDGLFVPAGLAWGPDGRIYVTDVGGAFGGAGKVIRYDADGTNPVQVTPTGFAPGDLAFSFPSAVAFDGLGHFLTGNLGPAYPPQLLGSVGQYLIDGTYVGDLVTSPPPDPQNPSVPSGTSPSQLVVLTNEDVSDKDTATLSSTLTPNPSSTGQPVSFTVSIAANGTGPAPTGSITFTVDGLTPTTVPLIGGEATFTSSTLGVGVHALAARYNGDVNYLPAYHAATQIVAPTLTSISPFIGPTTGFTVLLTGTGFEGSPIVHFGSQSVVVANNVSSTEIVVTAPSAGAGVVTVTVTNNGATSTPLSMTPGEDQIEYVTATLAHVAGAATAVGQSFDVTLTLSTTLASPRTFTLKDASASHAVVGSVEVVGSTGTATISGLAVGTHQIYADFAGDMQVASIQSNTLPHTVLPPPDVLSVEVNGHYAPLSKVAVSGSTVTFTSNGPHGFTTGEPVVIGGYQDANAGLNGDFTIAAVPTDNTFTVTNSTPGLPAALNFNTEGFAISKNTTSALRGAQRSMVNSIAYTFNQPVNSIADGVGLAIPKITTIGPAVPATKPAKKSDFTYTSLDGGRIWVVTWNSPNEHSIADGVYQITLTGANVVSSQTGAVMASDRTETFYRLFGDVSGYDSGSARVNAADNVTLSVSWLKLTGHADYSAALDSDADGRVNAGDFTPFSSRWLSVWSGFTPSI